MKPKVWLALLVLAGVFAAFWIQSRHAPAKSATAAHTPAAGVAANNPSPASFGYVLQPGDRLVYALTSTGTLSLGSADPAQAATVLNVSETGRCRVTVYSASEAGWLVGFALEDAKLSANNGAASQDLTPADLANAEVLVNLDKSGRIAQVQIPFTLSAETRNNWRDLLSKWQVILPQSAAKKWTRVEEDSTGAFVAQYSLAAAGLVKEKTRYLRVTASPALLAAYHVAGSAQIQFDGFPRSIQGVEKVDLGGLNGLPPTHSTGSYHFDLVSSTHGARPPAPNTASYTTMAWAAEFGPSSAPPEDEGNFTTNLHDLHASLASGGYNSPEEIRLATKLISQIKKDPALADHLLDALRGDNVSTQLASALLGILGAAGTPAAQYDLLAVAASPDWPPAFREMALFSYVQATDPVPEADATLKSLFEQGGDLSGSALLVLAAIGDKVRASDLARFQQINDYVANVLNTPSLPLNDFIVALDAIGNLGPAEVPAVVAKAAQNDSELIRAKAITSLARISTPASLALVVNAIANDASPDVQVAGVKTLAALKKAAAVDDLALIATNGKSPAARQEALTQLTNFADSNKNVAAILTTAAQSDASPEVRDYATKLLGTLPGNTPK